MQPFGSLPELELSFERPLSVCESHEASSVFDAEELCLRSLDTVREAVNSSLGKRNGLAAKECFEQSESFEACQSHSAEIPASHSAEPRENSEVGKGSSLRRAESKATPASPSSNMVTLDSFTPTSSNSKGCTCSKSRCLRLHCRCFGTMGTCSSECQCQNCLNRSEFKEARAFVIEKTLQIYPSAFQSRISLVSGSETRINASGCKCSTGCQKRYCECVKGSAGCSALCRCTGCRNEKVEMERGTVKRIFKTPVRRKHKILFRSEGSSPVGAKDQIIEFSRYRKKKLQRDTGLVLSPQES